MLDVEVTVDSLTLKVKVDGRQVVYFYNHTEKNQGTNWLLHKGVTMVVLHPNTGTVMRTSHFPTGQPRVSQGLVQMLNNLQSGRVLILAAPGDWKSYVKDETGFFLEDYLGGLWVADVCYGEMWVAVATVDGPLWAEALTTLKNHTQSDTSPPLRVAVSVPRSSLEQRCEWYSDPEQSHRASFCDLYEGYAEMCHCDARERITPSGATLDMKEQIPIVIVTSKKTFKVFKQIKQIWSQAGGTNTSILLSIDGLQVEARDFAKVLGIEAVIHNNPSAPGTISRISEHIRFSIWQGFKLFPQANKLIILEDDLMLAPDFISYFHQTGPLLDADNTIFCVNAFNYNSFFPSAMDTSRLYRESAMPAYGWMLTRELARELLPLWPSRYMIADWDVYVRNLVLNGRSVVSPEVSRTFHDGTGGLHVSGWEQVAHFDARPLNMDPFATVNISYLIHDAFETFLKMELASATVVEITDHPCEREYIPPHKVGSFVVYYGGETEEDRENSFYTLIVCFNGYEQRKVEHHGMMHTIGYYGNAVYVVSCPDSYYCNLEGADSDRFIYRSTTADLEKTIRHKDKRIAQYTHQEIPVRVKAKSFVEEVTLQNYVYLRKF